MRILITMLLAISTILQAEGKFEGLALVKALQEGGYNIYFRHAQTDWNQTDRITGRRDWESCDPLRVRQLSDQGRKTARNIGYAIRALKIPVGRVLASPYCRAVETVKLMDIGPVETTTDVMNLRAANYVGGRDDVIHRARMLLGTPPPQGTNTVIGAHGNVARSATSVYPDEGEGLVFLPHGKGKFTFVGRFTLSQWREFLQAKGSVTNENY